MKGHGVAGALASCRHTLRSAGVARGSLHTAREASADASLGADKAAILFANSPRAFRAGLKTRRRRRESHVHVAVVDEQEVVAQALVLGELERGRAQRHAPGPPPRGRDQRVAGAREEEGERP